MKERTGSQASNGGRWLDAVAIVHLALAVIVVGMVVQTCRIMASPERAFGVVESKQRIDGGEDPDTYQLRYLFAATAGGQHRGTASVSPKIYDRTSVGDSVTVQYAADDPDNNRLISETGDPEVLKFAFYGIYGLGMFVKFGLRRWLALRHGGPDPALT